jgi:hypothetical protein
MVESRQVGINRRVTGSPDPSGWSQFSLHVLGLHSSEPAGNLLHRPHRQLAPPACVPQRHWPRPWHIHAPKRPVGAGLERGTPDPFHGHGPGAPDPAHEIGAVDSGKPAPWSSPAPSGLTGGLQVLPIHRDGANSENNIASRGGRNQNRGPLALADAKLLLREQTLPRSLIRAQ